MTQKECEMNPRYANAIAEVFNRADGEIDPRSALSQP
mgnify:CR=1 FL=1